MYLKCLKLKEETIKHPALFLQHLWLLGIVVYYVK